VAPSVQDVRPDVPEEMDELVLALLAKDAARRPGGAAQVCRGLLPSVAGRSGRLPGFVDGDPDDPARLYSAAWSSAPG